MHITSNTIFILILCITLNVIKLNECSEQATSYADQQDNDSTTEEKPVDRTDEFISSDDIDDTVSNARSDDNKSPTDTPKTTEHFVRSHNYRSSYVSNKSTRLANKNRIVGLANAPNENTEDFTLKKRKKKKPINEFGNEIKYNVGPGVNISVEMDKELVSVYLDEDCLKDVFTGRGRKHDLITKILPLFILPFLIQSAVVPFLVSTLKLLLIKSIVVGKIAIFLLLLSAFKNHVKYAYEANPNPYYNDPPNRRTEAIAGYRVEGKPTAWIS